MFQYQTPGLLVLGASLRVPYLGHFVPQSVVTISDVSLNISCAITVRGHRVKRITNPLISKASPRGHALTVAMIFGFAFSAKSA